MAAGVNDEGGSRTELLDGRGDGQQFRVSGTSTGDPEHEHEHGVPSEGGQPGQNIPDLYYDTRRSGGGGHEDQGMVAKRPSEVIPAKCAPNDDQLGKYTQYTVRSGGSEGERQRPSDILASADVYQLRRGTRMT